VVSILEHSEAFSGRGTQPVLSNRRPQRSMIQNAMAVEKVTIQTLLLFVRTARSIIDIGYSATYAFHRLLAARG
jgi:hypothetical protein